MGMTREGGRMLALWIGAVVVGGYLALAVRLAATPVLYDQIRLHATSLTALDGGYLGVKVAITLVAAVAVAGPPALVLGRRLRRIEIPWIAASAVASLVAFLIPVGAWIVGRTALLMAPQPQPWLLVGPIVSGLETGLLIGLAQALVLRAYVGGAAWWVAASTCAFAVANVVTAFVGWQIAGGGTRSTSPADLLAEGVVAAILGYLIVGIVTGLMLEWLLREVDPEFSDAET